MSYKNKELQDEIITNMQAYMATHGKKPAPSHMRDVVAELIDISDQLSARESNLAHEAEEILDIFDTEFSRKA